MIPINSGLLRTLMQGGTGAESEAAGEEGGAEAPAAPPTENGPGTDLEKTGSNFNEKQAQNFLNFEGDFNATVEAEDGKLAVNAFYSLNASQREYDRLKDTLRFLLMQKPFENLMKDPIRESQELANKIADYVDKNDSINESKGGERGPENSEYTGTEQKPKNAKLLTLDELILIPGMSDDILSELKKHVTVYKSTDKINACLATDELLRAMIIAFTQRE